jgi:hypothetical protein
MQEMIIDELIFKIEKDILKIDLELKKNLKLIEKYRKKIIKKNIGLRELYFLLKERSNFLSSKEILIDIKNFLNEKHTLTRRIW